MAAQQHVAPESSPDRDPAPRWCQFGPVSIQYDDRVLEPRPWTFQQSAWAVEVALDGGPGPFVELCSGAGHIGLAAAFLSGRRLVQVDASPVACEFARANAAAAGLSDQVEVICGDLADVILPEGVPLVIADPPYLPSGEVAAYPDDPVLAVDGGEDGLGLIRSCLRAAERVLAPSGTMLLQVWGLAQAAQVEEAAPTTLTPTEVRLFGPTRAVMRFDAAPRRTG